MVRVQSVLCPVDFSEHSRRAFEYAVALAAFHHARLTVLTVIDPLLAQAAAVHCDPDYLRESEAELRAFVGDTSLESISWAPTPRLVVTLGRAGDRILEVARSHEADLIAMGTQGLGGLRKFVDSTSTDTTIRTVTAGRGPGNHQHDNAHSCPFRGDPFEAPQRQPQRLREERSR
jgi:universal stress protein A